MPALLRQILDYTRSLLSNLYFWGGLVGLALIGLAVYVVVDTWLMPTITRHDVAVTVPNVLELPFEDAEAALRANNLTAVQQVGRFNPNVPRDVVVDQNPLPEALVKPGRQIYLTINSGDVPTVVVPNVRGLSLREAKFRMITLGLKVAEENPDPIPDPHPNTVTRQTPPPGSSVDMGSEVTLWYSTGLGEAYVTVPDVRGQTVAEAQRLLLNQYKLRSVVIGGGGGTVQKQSQEPGTRVREGFEIRLFTQ